MLPQGNTPKRIIGRRYGLLVLLLALTIALGVTLYANATTGFLTALATVLSGVLVGLITNQIQKYIDPHISSVQSTSSTFTNVPSRDPDAQVPWHRRRWVIWSLIVGFAGILILSGIVAAMMYNAPQPKPSV